MIQPLLVKRNIIAKKKKRLSKKMTSNFFEMSNSIIAFMFH